MSRLEVDPTTTCNNKSGLRSLCERTDQLSSPEGEGFNHPQRVEEAWRTLKSGLKLRPVSHWASHRIQAHVALTVLALLLERVAEHACGDTWRATVKSGVWPVDVRRLSC